MRQEEICRRRRRTRMSSFVSRASVGGPSEACGRRGSRYSGGCPRSLLTATSGGRALHDRPNRAKQRVLLGIPLRLAPPRSGSAPAKASFVTRLPPRTCPRLLRCISIRVLRELPAPLWCRSHTEQRLGCRRLRRRCTDLVTAMLAAPASYYLNIHTAEFAAGAVRGQLTGTSAAVVWLGCVRSTSRARASPTRPERPSSVSARTPAWSAIDSTLRTSPFRPVAAHIHRGAAATNGPVWSRSPHPAPTATRAVRHRVVADPDRRDPRQPGRLLRQRPHNRASGRRDPPNSAKSPPPDSGPS